MAPTPEKLRHAIDRGATGGKVSFSDPAAVPLGTDEEAAGTPVPTRAVRLALDHEVRRAPKPIEGGSESHFWPGGVIVVIIAVAIALAAAIILLLN